MAGGTNRAGYPLDHMSSQYIYSMYRLSRTHPPDKQVLEGHLALLLPRREDRRARPQRLRQVDAAADHGRAGHRVPRRGAARARRHRRPARAGAAARRDQGRARQRRGRRRRDARAARPLQRARRRTTPTRPPTSSPASRRRSTPPTPGTSTRSSTRRWTRCASRRPTPTSPSSPAASAAASRCAGCCSRRPTCCCSTSRRTTSTPSPSPGSSSTSRSTRARSSRSPTIATSSTTSRAGSSSSTAAAACPFKGNYSSWLEQKQERLAAGGAPGVLAPAHDRGRARVGAPEPEGPAQEVQGAPEQLRAPARRGAQRQARHGPDPHPARAAPRRQGDRGRRASARASATGC